MSTARQNILRDELKKVSDRTEMQNIADDWIAAVIMELLEENRLFGEVLIQVPRAYNFSLTGMMGIGWQNNQVELQINPARLVKLQRSEDLSNLLMHEVLHLIWQHPLRYADNAHQKNVTLATDAAVNQYLDDSPAGTMTCEALAGLIGKRVPSGQDSQLYLNLIDNAKYDEGQSESPKQTLDETGEPISKAEGNEADVHLGWEEVQGDNNLNEQTANLQQMLTDAWDNVPDKQRGLLAGDIVAKLENINENSSINWKSLIKRSLGKMPLGKRDSHSRFNRRQPLRMDLPGQITNLVVNIDVFIDNSGSMSDQEVGYLLNELRGILAIYEAKIDIYSFDSIVHEDKKYAISSANQISFERVGGGGTSFQVIFDYLHEHHANNDSTLAIILTDGWGESQIEKYRFSNVLWVLTTDTTEFSVNNAPGRVTTLADDENYLRLVGKK